MKKSHGGAGRGQGRKPHPDPKVSRRRIMFRGEMWDELEAEAIRRGTTVNMLVEYLVTKGLS